MKAWSFYSLADGLFTGRIVTGSSPMVDANKRSGEGAIEGRWDRVCQRGDVQSMSVVDHKPPQPSADHEWVAQDPTAPTRAGQRWRWIKR